MSRKESFSEDVEKLICRGHFDVQIALRLGSIALVKADRAGKSGNLWIDVENSMANSMFMDTVVDVVGQMSPLCSFVSVGFVLIIRSIIYQLFILCTCIGSDDDSSSYITVLQCAPLANRGTCAYNDILQACATEDNSIRHSILPPNSASYSLF